MYNPVAPPLASLNINSTRQNSSILNRTAGSRPSLFMAFFWGTQRLNACPFPFTLSLDAPAVVPSTLMPKLPCCLLNLMGIEPDDIGGLTFLVARPSAEEDLKLADLPLWLLVDLPAS